MSTSTLLITRWRHRLVALGRIELERVRAFALRRLFERDEGQAMVERGLDDGDELAPIMEASDEHRQQFIHG